MYVGDRTNSDKRSERKQASWVTISQGTYDVLATGKKDEFFVWNHWAREESEKDPCTVSLYSKGYACTCGGTGKNQCCHIKAAKKFLKTR